MKRLQSVLFLANYMCSQAYEYDKYIICEVLGGGGVEKRIMVACLFDQAEIFSPEIYLPNTAFYD